jgi:hypothetical protein
MKSPRKGKRLRIAVWFAVVMLVGFALVNCERANGPEVAELKTHLDKAKAGSATMRWSNIKYDVRKSYSLVSGLITASVDLLDSDQHVSKHYEYKVSLAYSDGQWRISKLQAEPGIVHGNGMIVTFGWQTFTPDQDNWRCYSIFQKSFGLTE